MAGNATIMPVDVFNYGIGTYEDLIRAIIYATDNGARVINMSLGASSYSRGEEAAVDYAWNHGAVVVAAAGNTGRNTYHYPAAHPNAIAVAATDASDNRAGFSTYGDFVDVAAPGASIYSTLKSGGYGYYERHQHGNAARGGPGRAALLAEPATHQRPGARADRTRTLDDLGTTGWDLYFGHGRINARKALAAVAPPPQPSPTPTPHPPLAEWPAGCQDLVADGDFEAGLGSWQASGTWTVDATQAYSGTKAAHFTGGPNASGFLTRTLTLTQTNELGVISFPHEGTLWFAFRIESQDGGWGSTPQAPYDDWLTAEFRSTDGKVVSSLLRTGNTADIAPGLPWDRYLYRMQPADLQSLGALGTVDLVFTAGNDADAAAHQLLDRCGAAVHDLGRSAQTPISAAAGGHRQSAWGVGALTARPAACSEICSGRSPTVPDGVLQRFEPIPEELRGRLERQLGPGQLCRREPVRIADIIVGGQLAAARRGAVDDQDAAALVPSGQRRDAVQAIHRDDDPRLLLDLPHHRFLRELVGIHVARGQRPEADARHSRPPHQQHARAVADQPGHRDLRIGEVDEAAIAAETPRPTEFDPIGQRRAAARAVDVYHVHTFTRSHASTFQRAHVPTS